VTTDESGITEDDVAELNRGVLRRTATIARHASTGLTVLGLLGVTAWVWIVARQQLVLGGGAGISGFFSSGDGHLSFLQRIDVFVSTLGLLLSAGLVGGLGLALRLAAEYSISASGGSLTGVEAGDPFLEDADRDSDDSEEVP